MKVRIFSTNLDWPGAHDAARGFVLDLSRETERLHLMFLYKALADSALAEVRFEGDTIEMIEAVRGMIQGAGYVSSDPPRAARRFYRPGDECFRVPTEKAPRAFLCPEPQPIGV